MHYLFAIARFYPYLALSFALVFFELGRHFRQRAMSIQWICWGMMTICICSAGGWFAFRGDVRSDTWVRYLIGER